MNEIFPSIDEVLRLFSPYAETEKCAIKLLGVRGFENSNNLLGVYDDAIFRVIHRDVTYWEASCDPGKYWIRNPINPKGCARLKEGLWWYEFGLHRGHSALVQSTLFEVDRLDSSGKVILSEKGRFGINLHSGGPGDEAEDIGKWSAGCQIIKSETPWDDKWNDFYLPLKESCEECDQTFLPYLLIDKAKLLGVKT